MKQKNSRAPRDAFPPSRVRQAGMTGGSRPGGGPTADDLAPETLIPEDRPNAADGQLRTVDESEIGAGTGLDEAELAEVEPVRKPRRDESAGDRGPGRMHSRNAARRNQGQG
jgi:hypothetical protein